VAKRTIGEANIKITADGVQEVKRDLRDVKSETQGVGTAFKEAAESADRGISSFRKFAGIATFAAGALATLAAAARGLAGGLLSVQDAANQMANDLRKATDVSQVKANIESLRETAEKEAPAIQRALLRASGELDRTGTVLGEIEFVAGKVLNVFTGMADESGSAFRSQADALRELAETRRRELLAAEDAKEQDRLRLELTDLQISQLSEIEQIEARYAQRSVERSKQIREAQQKGNEEQVEFLNQIQDQESRIAEQRIREIKDGQAAERQAEKDSQEADESSRLAEELRKTQDALREAAKAAQDSAKIINDNNRAIERLHQQVVNLVPAVKKTSEESTRRRAM